jgi:hypothetical protein
MKMKIQRTIAAVMASSCLVVGAGVLAALAPTTASFATTTPPWEPDSNSVGGLVFYNSSGNVVTGGNLSDAPIAAYVEGTSIVRSGDTKATLYGYLPIHGQAPGAWSGEALGTSTTYPPASGPSVVTSATKPVETGAVNDENISTLMADFPNSDVSSDGYAHIYQLRLRTSTIGNSPSIKYDSADILISGSTWSVLYTTAATVTTSTGLSLSVGPSTYYGTSVKLTATVTPSDAVGNVQFFDGSNQIGQRALSAGTASLATTSLSDSTHSLTAKFVPSDANAFTTSTSSVKSLKVTAHPTTTTLKSSKTTAVAKQAITLTATVSLSPNGTVTFYDGAKKISVVSLLKGSAHVTTSSLSVGVHSIKAVFTPKVSAAFATSTSSVVKITVKK